MATINYLSSNQVGSFVYDGQDSVADYYEKQKVLVERFYMERKLDRLQTKLASLIRFPQHSADLNYPTFIKEKTGYEVDLFAGLQERIDAIISQNEIRSQKEMNEVGWILNLYYKSSTNNGLVEQLKALIIKYSEKTDQFGYTEIISSVEKPGIVEGTTIVEGTMIISTGPKPKHLEESEVISPDGKRKLVVTQWSDGKNSSTYVVIMFPTVNGPVYGVNGIHDVKAFWKDNSTIVIETRKDSLTSHQVREVRSFDDVILIEYREV